MTVARIHLTYPESRSVPEALWRTQLSPASKAVLAWCFGRGNSWEFRLGYMCRLFCLGETAWKTIRAELIQAGFFTQKRYRNQNGKFDWLNEFSDAPLYCAHDHPSIPMDGDTTHGRTMRGATMRGKTRDIHKPKKQNPELYKNNKRQRLKSSSDRKTDPTPIKGAGESSPVSQDDVFEARLRALPPDVAERVRGAWRAARLSGVVIHDESAYQAKLISEGTAGRLGEPAESERPWYITNNKITEMGQSLGIFEDPDKGFQVFRKRVFEAMRVTDAQVAEALSRWPSRLAR